jgi:cupin fold WbuC family metalloprotein
MIDAVEPGSYIRPHRHLAPPKAESLVLIRGSLAFIAFLENGTPDRDHCVLLSQGAGAYAVDCREGVWHTLFALEPGTVFFEARSGPYQAEADKDFAPWAPPENAPEAAFYLQHLETEFRRIFPAP